VTGAGLQVPIRTERLLLRPVRLGDEAALTERRSHPDVARYQSWTPPYPPKRAAAMIAEIAAMPHPVDDHWWMLVIADPDDTVTYGDLAIHLGWGARSAEIGFTLAREHWGDGYATEALGALVDRLFADLPMTRVEGRLHPDNIASAMVLERTGFIYEGQTRLSYWVGEDNTDDRIYGLTRSDRTAWLTRPAAAPEEVRLVEIDTRNERAVCRLATHKSQERFVAPMMPSFVDALFPEVVDGYPVVPWFRAVEADGDLVGFVMFAETTEHHAEPYLWRLLIDRLHQRRGIGGRVLELVARHCAERGDRTLLTSWIEGRGSPGSFYEAHGFVLTEEIVDGETEARRDLG